MPQLAIRLFGGFQVELGGRLVTAFGSDRTRALLVYLAVESDLSHRRDALAELLWPERPPGVALTNLRQTLHRLRGAIADRGPTSSCLRVTAQEVRLAPSTGHRLDVREFTSLLELCRVHHPEDLAGCEPCRKRLERAAELYRGEFLAGFSLPDSQPFAEWASLKQEEFHHLALAALQALTDHYQVAGDHHRTAECARRQLELEPWREEAHAQRMRALALAGRREAALRQFELCQRVLAEELHEPPSSGLVDLYERIRAGAFGPREAESAPELPAPVSLVTSPEVPRPAAFVARERELARLDEQLAGALRGQGRVVFVTGEAGSGKTSLLAEFASRATRRRGGLLVAVGKCDALHGVGDPYLPIRELFRMLSGDVEAGLSGGVITGEHADRLLAALPDTARTLVETAPDLVGLFLDGEALLRRVEAYAPGSASWKPRLVELVERYSRRSERGQVTGPARGSSPLPQTELFAQAGELLRAIARRHPLVLVLDDLQWADKGSCGLLFHLGRHLAGSAILVLGAYRPEEVTLGREGERHPLEPVVNELARQPGDALVDLGQAAGREFVDALLDSDPNRLGEGFRDTLYKRTGGHALFTAELLRDLLDRGDLVRDESGRWVEGQTLDWARLPTRVEAAIAERIERLPALLQATLATASVEGEEFTAEVVALVRGVEEERVVRALSGPLGRRHQLVMARSFRRAAGRTLSRYRFRHYLFQQYLYGRLDEVERARLHGSVGLALEMLHGEASEEIAVQLAWHFEVAGLTEKALEYLLLAGNAAARLSANAEAAEHLTHGLSLLAGLPPSPERNRRELEIQLALASPLMIARGWGSPDLARAVSRARELGESLGETGRLLPVLGPLALASIGQGRRSEAIALSEQLLALAERAGDPSQVATAHYLLGTAMFFHGDVAPARVHFDRVLAEYGPPRNRPLATLPAGDVRVPCLLWAGWNLLALGYPDQGLRRYEDALALAQSLGDPFAQGMARVMAGGFYLVRREYEAATNWVKATESAATERELAFLRPLRSTLRGRLQVREGGVESGLALMREGIDGWGGTGTMPGGSLQLQLLAGGCLEAGKVEFGLGAVRETMALMEESDVRIDEAEIHRLEGELILSRQPSAISCQQPAGGRGGAGHEKAGGGQVRADQEREAESCFLKAIEVARRQQAKSWELRAATSLARLWWTQGKALEARGLLAPVYGWFTEGFDTPDLVDARRLLAEL